MTIASGNKQPVAGCDRMSAAEQAKYLGDRLQAPCTKCICIKDGSCDKSIKECREELEQILGKGWFEQHPFGLIDE